MALKYLLAALAVLFAAPAFAQTADPTTLGDVFSDGNDNAKIHKSGFVCPLHVGDFERDAAGEADPEVGADFCAYSALNGIYGTVTLIPVTGTYDPKASMAANFAEQEQTGSHQIAEGDEKVGAGETVYMRTYETSKLEDLHYRVTFAGQAVNGWAVEVTAEYADPRDTPDEKAFVAAVYDAAAKQIVKK